MTIKDVFAILDIQAGYATPLEIKTASLVTMNPVSVAAEKNHAGNYRKVANQTPKAITSSEVCSGGISL